MAKRRKRKYWTRAELHQLIHLRKTKSNKEIAQIIGKTPAQVANKSCKTTDDALSPILCYACGSTLPDSAIRLQYCDDCRHRRHSEKCKKYREKNKERIRDKARIMYHQSEEYRAKVKARNQKYMVRYTAKSITNVTRQYVAKKLGVRIQYLSESVYEAKRNQLLLHRAANRK